MPSSLPYRFAVLSYFPGIEALMAPFSTSGKYTFDYFNIDYYIQGLGAKELVSQGYDVVLVYTGFALSIMDKVGYAVVNIQKTDMDIVHTLIKARKKSRVIGLPVHSTEFIDVKLMEKLCDVTIHAIHYDTKEDFFTAVDMVYKQGVRVVGGGGLVAAFALERPSVTYFPIAPSVYSINNAIKQALSIAKIRRQEQTKHEQLVSVFRLLDEGVVLVDDAYQCLYNNKMARDLLNVDKDKEDFSQYYESMMLPDVLRTGEQRAGNVVSINKRQLVVNTLPVSLYSDKKGAVSFLRDVASVHDSANRIRATQKQQLGFVARHTVEDIKGNSPEVTRLRNALRTYAPHDSPVLIHGETGTGKDLAAQALHNASPRRDAPFVAVNCAALPDSLLESELFGYEEGAFTGAKRGGKAGVFEMAHTGTLFLDEVGDIGHNAQLKLLRALEAKEVLRVGGSQVIPVDIRVVSASHKSLARMVAEGQFRADLFYRLAVLSLRIPPLRQRPDDIPILTEDLLQRYGHSAECLSPAILSALRRHEWPGNIRELRSVVESYLILLGSGTCDEKLFMDRFTEWTTGLMQVRPASSDILADMPEGDLKTLLEEVRRRIVQKTVMECSWNKALAAKRLGISYPTLWRILDRHEPEEE